MTIKNGSNPVFEPNILAGVEGLEPSRTVLETGMLPLHHTPKERHIKFLLCSICNIGTRLWRPLLYQLSYTPMYYFQPLYYSTAIYHCQALFQRKNLCKYIGFFFILIKHRRFYVCFGKCIFCRRRFRHTKIHFRRFCCTEISI